MCMHINSMVLQAGNLVTGNLGKDLFYDVLRRVAVCSPKCLRADAGAI